MFNNDKKQNDTWPLPWSQAAKQGLEQAIKQVPMPAFIKTKVRAELARAAEEAANKVGHSEVTAGDLLQGLLAKMPGDVRQKVEDAVKRGPEGLAKLREEFENPKP